MVWRMVFAGLSLLSLASASQKSRTQLVQETLATMCPYSTFCHANASKELTHEYTKLDLCCRPCSCESDCWKPGNCCIDKDGVADKRPIFNCRESYAKRSLGNSTVTNGFDGRHRRHRIIDFCPDAKTDSELDTKCRLKHPASLEELIWVSDTESGVIYQNQFCAECNGVKDYTHWQTITECYGALRSSFSSLFRQIYSDDCKISYVAPDNMSDIVDKYSCFEPTYNECNETGRWKDFDQDILFACNKFDSPVFQPTFAGGHEGYRNIFCFLCNQGNSMESFCPNLYSRSRTTIIKFSALINIDLYISLQENADDDNHNKLQCRQEEFFDIYMEVCRPLVCPPGKTPVHGHCEQLAVTTDGLGFQMNFYIEIQESSNLNAILVDEEHQELLAKTILGKFRTASGIRSLQCDLCALEILATKNVSQNVALFTGFYILGHLYTKPHCQLDDIFPPLKDFVAKNWKVRIADTEYLVLRAQPETRTVAEIKQISELLFRYKYVAGCTPGIEFSSEFFCPAVYLNYLEVLSLADNKKKRLLKELFEAKQHSNGVLRLCVEEYYSFMSHTSSADTLVRNGMQNQFVILVIVFQMCTQS